VTDSAGQDDAGLVDAGLVDAAGPADAGPVIDLNSDLGEGFGIWKLGDDEALLAIVTSANIACGFHGGDPLTMRRACANAVARGVAIGAQVSYRDLAGFGRREMDVPANELTAEILYQMAALDGIARTEGGRVSYVKPHGALYNRAVRDPVQAAAIVAAIVAYDRKLPLLTLPGGAVARVAADAGLTVMAESFADRSYNSDGTLMSRREPGSVLTDPGAVTERTIAMATRGVVRSADGHDIVVHPRSVCLHGDTPGAVALARAVRDGLEAAGVRLAPFA
jgi:5-oxoprolinase (ATP-hydrolysing) subunit A